MQKRRLVINAFMSVVQLIVNAIILFLLYKFILRMIGVDKLGIWSMVMAITSLSRFGDLGISSSVVKYVAKYLAQGKEFMISSVIETSVISIGLFIGLLSALFYYFAPWLLSFIIPNDSIGIALSILPYALISLWITSVSGVFQNALDGLQKIYIKAIILTGGTILNFIICLIFVPVHGIMALAYAQLIQSICVAFFTWYFLKQNILLLPYFSYKWNKRAFKEMISYGINAQIAFIVGILCDPVTKGLLSRFGGLSTVGYYEMASRIVTQFRAIITTANQALVPAIAELQENNKEYIKTVYKESYRLLIFIAIPSFFLLISLTPYISQILIGHTEQEFIFFSIALSIAFMINTLNIPAYNTNLGIGYLRWNTISLIVMATLNIITGYILGHFFKETGVLIGWCISVICSGFIVIISFHIGNKISFKNLFPPEILFNIISNIAGLLISFKIYNSYYNYNHKHIFAILITTLFMIILIISFYTYPDRNRILEFTRRELISFKSPPVQNFDK